MRAPEREPVPTPGDPLDRLFYALSDRTRRRILSMLVVGPARVTDLARPFSMSLPAVSKHLRILERSGLVRRAIDGRVHRLSLRGGRLREVETWLDPFRAYWDTSLKALRNELVPASAERVGGPTRHVRGTRPRAPPVRRRAQRGGTSPLARRRRTPGGRAPDSTPE